MTGMTARTRKITVSVSKSALRNAQALTGEGISETVRIGLRYLILEKRHPGIAADELLQLVRVVSERIYPFTISVMARH